MSYRENTEQKNLLNQFLAEHGVQLSEETLDKLYQFADLVVDTKQFGNLISAKDSEKFLSRHIADSLVPFVLLKKSLDPSTSPCGSAQDDTGKTLSSIVQVGEPASVLSSKTWADMGAGAGCPIFPLAIAMPWVQFYAVEPRHMRVEFMNYAKEKLGLKNLTVVGKRFETSGLADLDFISCRALSTFENDWERAQPALKKGGLFVTLKSFNSISHLENDPAVNIWKYKLPNEEQDYALVTRGNND
ncbi:MAG: class I SAM-dependent methyltransferase [Fibrobacter sp.]|nr:class I SAM-dependent methyltransferase [Fibrobacter sp.]